MKKGTVLTLAAFSLALFTLMVTGGCSSTGESHGMPGYDYSGIDKVAVIDIAGDIKGDTAKNQIADFFSMELIQRGFKPVERSQVMSLLAEQSFQAMDTTSDTGAAQAGRILNVPVVLIANVNYGEHITMTAKMIDVEDASMLWIGSGSGKTGKGLTTIAAAVAGAVAGGAVAGDDRTERTVGAVAGGILGGVAGEALTPQQAQQAQKVIKKMCQTLPLRYGKRSS